MTINVTLFDQMARDPRLKGVVGDFTSSSLLEIDNESQPTFELGPSRFRSSSTRI